MNEYMNTVEAAEYLGVSDRTVRKLCADRKIKHQRINGRTIRLKKEWLDEYLSSAIETIEPENQNEKE